MWTSTMEKLSGMSAIYPRDTGSDCLVTSSPEYGKNVRMTSGLNPRSPVIHGKRL